ncbi:hemicentin-1 [Oryzias melastigma]|nr:hemicentin-1 [Oryzias melastigma]
MEGRSEGLFLLIMLQGFLASGGVEVRPSINPAVAGGAVTLSLVPSENIKTGSWSVGQSPVVTWQGTHQAVFPSHTGRAFVNISTGALTLTSLTVADSGVYEVLGTDPQLRANTSITVEESISNVTLTVTQTGLLEFQSSALMNCSVSAGSSLSYVWMNSSSVVTVGDRVHLSNGGSTLSVSNLTRFDSGPFKCLVSNPVSNGTSNTENVTVSYGPDNMALTVNGQETTSFTAGSNLTMLCSAQSNPAAQLQWAFKGALMNSTGTQLQLIHVTENQTGSYSCLAFNNNTSKYNNITRTITISSSSIKKTGTSRDSSTSSREKFSADQKMERRLSSGVMLVLILTVISVGDPVFSQSPTVSELFKPVGGNVTLSGVSLAEGGWLYNCKYIALIFGDHISESSVWKERISINATNYDLTIRALNVNDSGVYSLSDVDNTFVSVKLSVQVPISNVNLNVSQINLVEFIDTVVFTCFVSAGSSVSYKLLNETSTGVAMVNGTFTLPNVTRDNRGPFRCVASNGLGDMTSPSVQLNVRYGPDMPVMKVMPEKAIHVSGSGITLSCSADSNPSATVQWKFNGVNLNQNSPQLQLQNVSVNNSGVYECIVHNPITLRYNSGSVRVQIMDPITSVVVKNTGGPAILNKSLTLQCQVTGPVEGVQWWKEDQLILSNSTATFGDNWTLTFNAVQHSDDGTYMCKASNSVSNMSSSPFQVTVHYGPERVTVSGTNLKKKSGDNVTLSCQAESNPPSHFTWYFNDVIVSSMSTFVSSPLTKELSGQYTCVAFNNITNLNSSDSINISVIDPIVNVTITTNTISVIENERHELTCEVTGDVDEIHWMTEQGELEEDNTTMFHMDNKTVKFVSVDHDDAGTYHCTAVNVFGNMTSRAYNLVVNYGPKMTTVKGPSVATEGSSVSMSCSADSLPESSFSWYFNGSKVSNMSQFTTPPLTKELSGQYTCEAFNSITNRTSNDSLMLSVIESISNVQVQSMNSAVERQPYNLTCGATGPVDSIHWMKDSKPLQAGSRIVFLQNNKTVSFMPAERSDTGNYQCMACNQAENVTSVPYNLIVNYGPGVVNVTGPGVEKAGKRADLSCSAESTPMSHFTWHFGGSVVANTSVYVIPFLTQSNSGKYVCTAFNNVTNQNRTGYLMLSVVDPITEVQIEQEMSSSMEGYSYSLQCNVTGSVDNIYWMKDGMPLQADNRTVFMMDNKTVKFVSVKRSDAGNYSCMAVNSFENMTSSFNKLVVNYGPDTPVIQGPEFGEVGSEVVFSCSASSTPPSHFSWWFNDSQVAVTSMLTVGPLTFNMSGNYTCMAHNSLTGKNSTNSTVLTVIEGIKSIMIQNNTIPINQQNFSLTCDIVGPYDAISWMKDGEYLNVSDSCGSQKTKYCTEKNMLHFTPVTLQDEGKYQCAATNKAAAHKSPEHTLLTIYGPLKVTISRSNAGSQSTSVSLTCWADSRPQCDFQWFFTNQTTPLKTGPQITFNVTQAGIYVCKATNPVTKVTMYQTEALVVGGQVCLMHFAAHGSLLSMSLLVFSAHVLFR